jgi:hypothetical protein
MALWNCGKGEACAFTYRREGNKPSVIWRGTWDVELEPRVVQAWGKVASKYTPTNLGLKSNRCIAVSSIPMVRLYIIWTCPVEYLILYPYGRYRGRT